MSIFLRYWQVIAGAVIALGFSYLLHKVVLNARLVEQETALRLACRQAQTLSYEVSHEYQSNLANLANRLSDLNRVRACVPISNATSGRDDPAEGSGHGKSHGVDSSTLFAYAGDAERYRLQLMACQDFVKKAAQ